MGGDIEISGRELAQLERGRESSHQHKMKKQTGSDFSELIGQQQVVWFVGLCIGNPWFLSSDEPTIIKTKMSRNQ